MAKTYSNLSDVARNQDDIEAAEEWLRKALQIFEKKDEVHAVINLGKIAERRGDFGNAEKLYRKALEIAEKNRNDEQGANCLAHLGSLACQ